MSRRTDLPIIIGANLRKGIVCLRVRNGYEMWIVWLNKDMQTGEQFDWADIEKIQAVLHFTDREAVQNTINALDGMLKFTLRNL